MLSIAEEIGFTRAGAGSAGARDKVPMKEKTDLETPGRKRKKRPPFKEELTRFLETFPDKVLFLTLTGLWFLLFHLFGNSTFGYTDTHSLFGWLNYDYGMKAGDEHGYLVPFAFLALIWYEKKRFMEVKKEQWWPTMILVLISIGIHLVGYRVQQVRISVIGFFLGWYGIMGMVWGPAWLRAVFFPYILFAFCFPIGTLADRISVPLRLLSSVITEDISNFLGIKVIRNGTMLSNEAGDYRYEVAAACSGLRSLIATLGIAIVYGFLTFKTAWRRGVMVLSAIPLAVAANVTRLMMIIFAGEIFGQEGGTYVHDSSVLSMVPYLVAFFGMFLIAHFLREDRGKERKRTVPDDPENGEEQSEEQSEEEEVSRD